MRSPTNSPRRRGKVTDRGRREFSVIVERDEDWWYVGSVPEIPGCHTQARSLDALMKRIREAILAGLEDGSAPVRSQFVGVQRIVV